MARVMIQTYKSRSSCCSLHSFTNKKCVCGNDMITEENSIQNPTHDDIMLKA